VSPPARAGWRRLTRHSYRLGLGWLARAPRAGLPHARQALIRLLVPLDPWRYWELGRLADEPFAGRALDVGSPKLLPSLLAREGRGEWTSIDLLPEEVAAWRAIDPRLDLREADARALPFPDATFDACTCVSVIEHVPGEGDAAVMAELWRVLRPGGVLHLTTNVAPAPRVVTSARPVYGEASPEQEGGGAFFERHYTDATLRERLLGLPWIVEADEVVRERRPVHRAFVAGRPLSFLLGGLLLPLVARGNFVRVAGSAGIPPDQQGAVYLRLRRPERSMATAQSDR
jgi:SAM-dependent methyltransferase